MSKSVIGIRSPHVGEVIGQVADDVDDLLLVEQYDGKECS